jgi:hypothetical protein
MVASVIVRGPPTGPARWGRVGLDAAAPSPPTMVMTMVRASDRRTLPGPGRRAVGEPERHVHHEDLVVAGVSSTTRWLNAWVVPHRATVEPVGMMSSGSQTPGIDNTAIEASSGSLVVSVGRSVASRQRRQSNPRQDAVVVSDDRLPARLSGCAEGHAVPPADDVAADDLTVLEQGTEVGTGAGPRHQRPRLVPPEHDLAAGDGPGDRALRADVPAAADDVPTARVLRLRDVERRPDPAGPRLLPRAPEVLVRHGRHVLIGTRLRISARILLDAVTRCPSVLASGRPGGEDPGRRRRLTP